MIPFLFVVSAFAATPVAAVTSASNFDLSGVNVIAAGVPSWPLMPGDTLVAGTSAARIRFIDGTMVTLSPRSKITVQEKGKSDDLSVQLVNGFMTFTLGPSSSLSVYSGNTPVPALPGVTTTASAAQVGRSATDALPPGLPPSISRH